MSIIKRLEELYKHNCMNCEYLEMYHDGCSSGSLYIDYDCSEIDFYAPQFFWDPYKENDCKSFKQNSKIGSNRAYIRQWQKECYGSD